MRSSKGDTISISDDIDFYINKLHEDEICAEEQVQAWVARQYQTLALPEARLNKRCIQVVATMAGKPNDSINRAAGNWAEAKGAYRFIENDRVQADDLMYPIGQAAAKNCAGHKTILAIQDTSTISFDSAKNATGLGTINHCPDARGMFYHPVLALDKDGLPLGLLDQQHWCREPKVKHKAKDRKKLPVSQKESSKWLKGAANANLAVKTNLPEGQRPEIMHIFDREGDVHEVFELIEQLGDKAIIRCNHNRRALNAHGHNGYAHDLVRQTDLLGEVKIDVPRKVGQKKRKANLQVRVVAVTLDPNQNHPQRRPVALTLVEAFETDPPEKTRALHWLLWTTESIHNFDDALTILHFYTLRWKIEDLFFVLKQGCKIEKLQFETAERLAKVLALYAPIALRILYSRDLARLIPDAPCTILLDDLEWKVLWAKIHNKMPPKSQKPPNLKQAVLWIGRLGGHLNRQSDGMPGSKTLWRGFRDLALLTEFFAIARS